MIAAADIFASLNMLLAGTGVGAGGTGIYVLFRIARFFLAYERQKKAEAANQQNASTNGALDGLVHDWLMKVIGPKLAQNGSAPALSPDELDAGANAIKIALNQFHGADIDSGAIRDKLQSGLGRVAMQVRGIFTALSNPGPPSSAQKAAASAMGAQ